MLQNQVLNCTRLLPAVSNSLLLKRPDLTFTSMCSTWSFPNRWFSTFDLLLWCLGFFFLLFLYKIYWTARATLSFCAACKGVIYKKQSVSFCNPRVCIIPVSHFLRKSSSVAVHFYHFEKLQSRYLSNVTDYVHSCAHSKLGHFTFAILSHTFSFAAFQAFSASQPLYFWNTSTVKGPVCMFFKTLLSVWAAGWLVSSNVTHVCSFKNWSDTVQKAGIRPEQQNFPFNH